MQSTILHNDDYKPQGIFFDDDGYNDEVAAKIDAYEGYNEWTDATKEHEPLPMPDFIVYAYDFTTGKYETWASDYLDTSTRIAFECKRTWRKKVGSIVFFRHEWDAKALKEHVETERFINPDAQLDAWGNPIPERHKELVKVNETWCNAHPHDVDYLSWVASRDMGGY